MKSPRNVWSRIARDIGLGCLLAAMLAGTAAAQREVQADQLKAAGRWQEALQLLREEIASPRRTVTPATHIANIRQRFLVLLSDYAWMHGFDEKMDAEARQVYETGMAEAGQESGLQAILGNGISVYYSKTYRNGLALPYFRRLIQHWLKTGNGYRTVMEYGNLANAHADMGDSTLARYYSAKMLEAGKSYFVFGVRPGDVNEWITYWTTLSNLMNLAAQRGDVAELERLWLVREPISGRYWGLSSITYFEAAEAFGSMGERQRAQDLLQTAQAKWADERPRQVPRVQQLMEAVVPCKEGAIRTYLAEYASAVATFDRCIKIANDLKLGEAETAPMIRGIAYEGAADLARASQAYEAAIKFSERVRGTYSLAERANFFRSVLRKAYWGQIRVQARLAAAPDGEPRFFSALHTSESIRARQLGELLDPEANRRLSPENLAQMQKRLPAEEIVLAYTATERDIVLLAMTSTGTRAAIIPYEPRHMRALVRSITADLARPDSAIGQLNARLGELGRLVLAPVADQLAGKQRITVLPDGLLSLVPFELLSFSEGEYRPLYRDYVVVNSPSLLFVEHAARGRKSGQADSLFALADPLYPKDPNIGGVPKEDLAIAARGSRYLSYFDPLPETRTEVQAIGAMFGGNKVELMVGDKALESVIKRTDLSGFSYLHFATHGVIGNEIPGMREPALVLGQEAGEDGFLTMSEVSKLKLDAELTVLSACNTGSGEFVEGEGVMGMSRAFLAAGSRSVVVSLWPVASKATERLMVAFYRHLRGGKSAAHALREAKLEMLKANPAESHPFFWAPFILMGG